MNEEKIIELSRKLRNTILNTDLSDYFWWFKDFPKGCCKESSLMLGKLLNDVNLGLFNIVVGERNGHTHVWLERDNLIVDITGDQFKDMAIDVYVGYDSQLHSAFTIVKEPEPYGVVFIDMDTDDYRLREVYEKIEFHMDLRYL